MPQPTKRIRGRALQRIRIAHLTRNPLCVRCKTKQPPVIKPATQLDHIVPLYKGGPDTESNRQGLCDACHEEKTAADLDYKPARIIGDDGYPR